MACGKCPNCGEQMQGETVYGIGRVCRCPECGHRVPHPEGPLGPKEGTKKKAVNDAFKEKKGE